MPLPDVLAVMLGGGRGTPLYPLTKLRSKPAIPFGGKYRLVDFALSNCINSGITRIFVLTQFLSSSLHRHIQRSHQFDLVSGRSVEILPADQTWNGTGWYQGTADAVRRHMQRILSREPREVLILSGDHLYRMDYSKFWQFHRDMEADVTVGVVPVPTGDAPRFGILRTNEAGRIVDFEEKPNDPQALERLVNRPESQKPYLASMGIYIFGIAALSSLLVESEGDDFGRHIIPAAIESCRVYAYPFEGYWEDIGTMSAFYEANLALTRRNPLFDLRDPQYPVYTRPRFLPISEIDGCRLEQVAVADGCCLYDANIEESVIGLRSMVRPGAILRQVVMMGADFYETVDHKAENRLLGRSPVGIGRNTSIERAIIDKNARIGDRVLIRSHEGAADRDEDLYSIRDGIVVVPKNTVIPAGTTI